MIKIAEPKANVYLTKQQLDVRDRIQKIKELEYEKEKLMHQKDEIKRLRNISHSPEPKKRYGRRRSRSTGRRFSRKRKPELSHERWTNCYARKAVQWSSRDGLLFQEKYNLPIKLKKSDLYPTHCCGNSPGKSHRQYCEIARPGTTLL